MDRGTIVQGGTHEDIYNQPANSFGADFIGKANFLDGVVESEESRLLKVSLAIRPEAVEVRHNFHVRQEVSFSFKPEFSGVYKKQFLRKSPHGNVRNST